MGKVSLSVPQPTPVTPSTPVTPIKTPHQVKSNLLPELTRKEWIAVLTAVFIVFSVGFSLGFVVNIKRIHNLSNVISIVVLFFVLQQFRLLQFDLYSYQRYLT